MTELALRNADSVAVTASSSSIERLTEWAQSASAVYQVAQSLVTTSFVPQAFKGKPDEATAAILSGMEIGLSPMASLRSFDVIQGQAAARALTLRAVVQSGGHEMWTQESTETRAIVCGRRRGSDKIEKSVWTIDRARGLALVGKDNWKKQPGAMLLARATSECARLVAADAILGIPYSSEELSDGSMVLESSEPWNVVPEAPKRTARRAPLAPVPVPEPDLDAPIPDVVDNSDAITGPQLKMLHAALGEYGLADRDAGLAWLSEQVGRTLTTSKELSKAEATRCIDVLVAPEPVEPPEPDFGDAQ